MNISVMCFTKRGSRLAEKISEKLQDDNVSAECRYGGNGTKSLKSWAEEQFEEKNALIFIGACGIAVRTIAPCVKDKLSDSPVLCIDEAGQFVIPILSGHAGGANELAYEIAGIIGAVPVITTASDVNGTFAPDVFAVKNDLSIMNRDGIARVTSKILDGQTVDIVISRDLSELSCGSLKLKPKEYIIGMGCRRGKSYSDIAAFIDRQLLELGLDVSDIMLLTSIDLKKNEEGLIRWSGSHRVPFRTYTADELKGVQGCFVSSDFVEECTGVDNVCERSAMLAAGEEGELIMHKKAENGMTIAVSRRKWRVKTFGKDMIYEE